MSDPASRLPPRPSLEQLRKQAKDLLREFRAGNADAAKRVRAILPRVGDGNAHTSIALADAQFVVAREYGFDNWARHAQYVDAANASELAQTDANLIRPIELRSSKTITLENGRSVPADAVWDMFIAARDGNLERVESLATLYPGLALFEYNYTPPIHFAAREGHANVVRYLLDRGADPAYRSYPFLDSLLTLAEDHEQADVVAVLRERLSRRFALRDGVTEILEAAKDGDLTRVSAEIARDPALARGSNDTGDTPLHLAAERGHLDLVNVLIAAGADVDAVRSDGYRPVHSALLSSWRAKVPRERARAIADTLFAHGSRYTIYLAAVLDDKAYVRDALARDSSLANFEDTCHRRPISAAAERNDLEMVKLLLENGADPNLPEEGAPRGHALWTAVYHRRRELARLLVEHGADPNAMVESSGTPMTHALKDPDLYELLVSHGGIHDRGARDELGRMIGDRDFTGVERMLKAHPALIAEDSMFWSEGILSGPSNGGDHEMLALLIRHGARVPKVTKWGRQYYFKHLETGAFLLEHGMDPNHMNWHHTTLLHQVASEGDIAKARVLLDHGADIDALEQEYRSTPLGMAARWGRREMVAFLLERGADPNLAGAPWATPLAWARKKGHAEVEADLRRAGAV